METTKEQIEKEALKHKAETLAKKAEVLKAEATEKLDEVKLGALDLAEKAADKFEDIKAKVKNAL